MEFKSAFERVSRSFGQHTAYSAIMISFFSMLVVVFVVALAGTLLDFPQSGAIPEEGSDHSFGIDKPSPATDQASDEKDDQENSDNLPDSGRVIGWQVEDGERYYYLADGTKATGTVLINGAFMRFDEQGRWQSTRLNVAYISQLPDMPSGCEVVSVTMMLNHAGIGVTKEEVAERLPYADDPEYGFTGSLYEDGSYWVGGIIYPPALLDLVAGFCGTAVDLTERSWSAICEKIDSGRPVCIWFGSDGLDHTVLLTGYSATEVWLNDPLGEEDLTMPLEDFMIYWEQNGYRALSY